MIHGWGFTPDLGGPLTGGSGTAESIANALIQGGSTGEGGCFFIEGERCLEGSVESVKRSEVAQIFR